MKQINVRFVLASIAVITVVGAIAYAVHAYQRGRHAVFFLTRAEQAENAGDLTEALRELSHYLSLVPDDNRARARMGILLAESQQHYAAFSVLEKALRHTDDVEARRTLVDVLMRLQRWQDARVHLEQHLLKTAPEDPQLLNRLAQCQWAAKEYTDAVKTLKDAVQIDPHQIKSYLLLGTFLDDKPECAPQDAEGNQQDADYWRDQMVQKNADVVTAHLIRAYHALATALPVVRDAQKSDPQRIDARTLLSNATEDANQAMILIRDARSQLAQARDTIAKGAGQRQLAPLLQAVRHSLTQLPQVETTIDRALRTLSTANNTQHLSDMLNSVDQAAQMAEANALSLASRSTWGLALIAKDVPVSERLQTARHLATKARKIAPNEASVYSLLAEIELADGNRGAAKKWLLDGVSIVRRQTTLPIQLTQMQLEDGQIAEARETITTMEKLGFPKPLLDYWTARAEFAENNWQHAIELLSKTSARIAEVPDLAKEMEYWLGRSYQNQNQVDLEMQAYRRALAIDPQFSQARLMLADALRRQGQFDQALEQYRAELGGTPAFALQAARIQLQRILSLPAHERDWTNVDRAIEQLAKTMPDNPDAILLHVDVLMARDRAKDAYELLDKARKRLPNSVEVRCAMAQLAMQQKDFAAATTLLDDALQDLGDSVPIRLMRGRLVVMRDGKNAASELKKLAANTDAMAPSQRIALWRRLAQLAVACGDLKQAAQLARQVVDAEPNSISNWLQMLAILLQQSSFAEAEGVLEHIAKIEGKRNGPIWNYCKAATLAAQANTTNNNPNLIAQALQHVDSTLNERPNWSQAIALAAELSERAGNREVAISRLLRLIQSGNGNAQVVWQAARLLLAEKRFAEAAALLPRLEQQTTVADLDLQRFKARLHAEMGNVPEALTAARIAAKDSQHYPDYLLLARLDGLAAAARRESDATADTSDLVAEGEKALQQAQELAADKPEFWYEKIQFATRIGRERKTLDDLLTQADVRFRDKPGVSATLYEAARMEDKASERYEQDLVKWPTNLQLIRQATDFCIRTGRSLMTTEQLQRIVAKQMPAEKGDVAWARRTLALAQRNEDGTRDLNNALSLIEQNLKTDPDSARDLYAKAVLLSESSDLARREEACKILESLIRDSVPNATQMRGLLAHLYLLRGDRDKALPHLRAAKDPVSLTRFVQGMLNRSQWNEAEKGLARLEQVAPNQVSTALLRARLCFLREEYTRAEQVLNDLVVTMRKRPDAANDTLVVASSLEKFANDLSQAGFPSTASRLLAKAETLLRERVTNGANECLELASFLAHHDKTEEALEILESHWSTADVAAIALCVNSLASTTSQRQQDLQQVQQVLTAALEKHNRPLVLLDSQARMLEASEHFDELVAVFREIITKDQKNYAAMNNLAELLALQGKSLNEAMTLVQNAIDAVGTQPALLDTRATVYLALGKPALAVQDMQEVVAKAPKANRYFHLARALNAANQKAAARAAMQKARELGLNAEKLHPLERDVFGRDAFRLEMTERE